MIVFGLVVSEIFSVAFIQLFDDVKKGFFIVIYSADVPCRNEMLMVFSPSQYDVVEVLGVVEGEVVDVIIKLVNLQLPKLWFVAGQGLLD